MPWTGISFQKHNHKLSPVQSAYASHIANHVLESTGNEGEAIATANKIAEKHRAPGGALANPPWFARQEARQDFKQPSLGFLHGPTPGRADAIDTTAPAGSHVIPADVVAGLGEGNSLAGASRMEKVIRAGPGRSGGRSIPRPPAAFHLAAGGQMETTPVKLSHGEYVVHPDDVTRWGSGDRKAGHAAWDKWIVAERKRQIKKLQHLPGPVGMKK